ncbi:MAG TPA: histidine--tRNA ligase, partial [Candidatus Eremiobacteraeota bacterium]|nr:histidine--tRNA ligase [Candidatus Eremiobacteraeota bacterium]
LNSITETVLPLIIKFYDSLGLKGLSVSLNSIGCSDCRPSSRNKIIDFCRNNLDILCDNCKNRFERNPFRILDCKNATCKELAKSCPSTLDSICSACKEHFNTVTLYLDKINISYKLENSLVRGLDYYTRTVFEVLSESLGAQSSLCGGGRYDDLIEILGGKPSPGVGVAAGIERLIMVMEKQGIPSGKPQGLDLMIIPLGESSYEHAFQLITSIRKENFISADLNLVNKGLKAGLNSANKLGVSFAIIIGDIEIARGEYIIRDLKKGEQNTIKIEDIIGYLKKIYDQQSVISNQQSA